MINLYFFAAIFFFHPHRSGYSGTIQFVQPKIRDTTGLLSHRWLVTATERAGKKTGATAGSIPLYMNFFSNGGFDFVGIGDGEPVVWKYVKGSVTVYHKSAPTAPPEASFRIEKINSRTMQISGIQAGILVRYVLSHGSGD